MEVRRNMAVALKYRRGVPIREKHYRSGAVYIFSLTEKVKHKTITLN